MPYELRGFALLNLCVALTTDARVILVYPSGMWMDVVVRCGGFDGNYMDLHGFTWIYMDLYGFIWIYLDLYGFIWIYMDLFGFIWIHMDLYWVCVGYHGFIDFMFPQ